MTRLLAASVIAITVACSGSPSSSQCAMVADHMLDLFTMPGAPPGETPPPAPAPGSSAAKALEAEKKRFRDNASAREHLVNRCKQAMTGSQAECILGATNELELAACWD